MVGGLPTWSVFLADCAKNIADPEEYEFAQSMLGAKRYLLAAEHIAEQIGDKLSTILERTFLNESRLINVKKNLIDPRWSSTVVSTNYDLILDNTLGGYTRVSVKNARDLFLRGSKLVKIHGSVDEPETCVVSIRQYTRAYDNSLEWFLFNLFQSKSVFFIGTSLDKSEPWAPILRRIKSVSTDDVGRFTGITHYAVLAVRDDDEARRRGKILMREFGIEIIPYIPNKESNNPHEIVEEILQYLQVPDPPKGTKVPTVADYMIKKAEWFYNHASANEVVDLRSFISQQNRIRAAFGILNWVHSRGSFPEHRLRIKSIVLNVLFDILFTNSHQLEKNIRAFQDTLLFYSEALDLFSDYAALKKIATKVLSANPLPRVSMPLLELVRQGLSDTRIANQMNTREAAELDFILAQLKEYAFREPA